MFNLEDINELLVMAKEAKDSGFKKLAVNPEHAITLCEMAKASIERGVMLSNHRAYFEGIIEHAPEDTPVEVLDMYRGFVEQIDEVLNHG